MSARARQPFRILTNIPTACFSGAKFALRVIMWSQIIRSSSLTNFRDPTSRPHVLARHRCGSHMYEKISSNRDLFRHVRPAGFSPYRSSTPFLFFLALQKKTIKGFRILTNVLLVHSLGANTHFVRVRPAGFETYSFSTLFVFFRINKSSKIYSKSSNPARKASSCLPWLPLTSFVCAQQDSNLRPIA